MRSGSARRAASRALRAAGRSPARSAAVSGPAPWASTAASGAAWARGAGSCPPQAASARSADPARRGWREDRMGRPRSVFSRRKAIKEGWRAAIGVRVRRAAAMPEPAPWTALLRALDAGIADVVGLSGAARGHAARRILKPGPGGRGALLAVAADEEQADLWSRDLELFLGPGGSEAP